MNCSRFVAALFALVLLLAAMPVAAVVPTDRPPDQGGYTRSMGIPPLFKTTVGVEYLSHHTTTDHEIGALLSAGVLRYIGNPVAGLLGLGIEGYAGGHASSADFGGRAYLAVPSLLLGAGVDYNAHTDESDFMLKLDVPIRRKGIVGLGSTVCARWMPHREQTFTLGVTIPIGDYDAGRTRPQSDYVKMDKRKPDHVPLDHAGAVDSTFAQDLRALGERAAWVARLTQPFAEHGGADAAQAMAPSIDSLRAHMAQTDGEFPRGHTVNEEIRAYHEIIDRLFSIAESGRSMAPGESTPEGRRIAARARGHLLDDVLFPYDSLIGQLKKVDNLSGMIAVARVNFARDILSEEKFQSERVNSVLFVFQTLCDIVEANRAELRTRWGDNRLVWLPLQYGLRPEDHDTQEEMNDIVARATGQELTAGNRVWYIMNEDFGYEMERSVRLAEDYHVLWVHDISGVDDAGAPDSVSYELVRTYLLAMTERVRAYDRTGKLPMYIILLDQVYFEAHKSRRWMRVLEDPLRHRLHLPAGYRDWESEIARLQNGLQAAVDESLMLQVERHQYGKKWLHNCLRVQVNITNPADFSFYSTKVLGKLPVPDNHMRDHRKIIFYDVSEDDPYRGMAMFTGMGIGEHYTGPKWEDRAVILQGPAALDTKNAARMLFKTQGFKDNEIPYPLRARPKPASYAKTVAAEVGTPSGFGAFSRVVELNNETGFTPKPLSVAKGVLYSLMPPGSVMKVPDSLWQNYLYASLIAGSSLRGCRALVIAPSLDAAPTPGDLPMARTSGLMKRLVVFGNAMDDYMAKEGGILKVGLYAPPKDAAEIAERFRRGVAIHEPWMNRVYHFSAALDSVALNARRYFDVVDDPRATSTAKEAAETPRLHLKANLLVSEQVWDGLMDDPAWSDVLKLYIRYLARQKSSDEGDRQDLGIREVPDQMSRKVNEVVDAYYRSLPPERQRAMLAYLTVGSANLDYRSQILNGEVMVVISGASGLVGAMDFLLLAGLCQWPSTPEEVDPLLPPPGWWKRTVSSFIQIGL